MKNVIAKVSEKNTARANPNLFNRNAQCKIYEYIVDGYKSLEALPYIKLVGYELITDESKIDIKLNRRHLKNKAIQRDKTIEKIKPIDETAHELLIAEFMIEFEGDIRYIKKSLLIPAYIDDCHLLVNGNEILPIYQLVDMSTYNQKKNLKLKTTLTPIEIYKDRYKKVVFENTLGEVFDLKVFVLNLFTKQLNPLIYYVAYMGVTNMISYFSMNGIVDVVDTEYNTEINHYFKVNKKLYIEADKRYFKESDFVQQFTFLLFELFNKRALIDDIDNIDYWTIKLGALFTVNTKNQLSKGKNVLISFSRILDDTTKRTLKLANRHLVSSHSLIRYEIQNFKELRKKDNYDMKYKRVRCNEALGFYFVKNMSSRLNQLLNKRKLSIESIERIFNFNEDELFRLLIYGTNPSTLLRYQVDINDFTALNALRVTKAGPQGLNCAKSIPVQARDIYPSQLGIIDINAVSHGSSTGITSMLCPTTYIDKLGFFNKESTDPDTFNDRLKSLKRNLKDLEIEELKQDINKLKTQSKMVIERKNYMKTLLNNNGEFTIGKRFRLLRNETDGRLVISSRTAKRRTYLNADGMLLDENDRFVIKRRKDPVVDHNGLVHISHHKLNLTPVDGMIRIRRRKRKPPVRNGCYVIKSRVKKNNS